MFSGLIALLVASAGRPAETLSFSIYGLCQTLIYVASVLYHCFPHCPRRQPRLFALDQVAIYLGIAGAYTPLCLLVGKNGSGTGLLAGVWLLALGGCALRVGWKNAPLWIPYVLYIVMGWSCLFAPHLVRALPAPGPQWMIAGGLIYTAGGLILATKRRPLASWLPGSHEMWHLCVLAGGACHFMVMVCMLNPTAGTPPRPAQTISRPAATAVLPSALRVD